MFLRPLKKKPKITFVCAAKIEIAKHLVEAYELPTITSGLGFQHVARVLETGNKLRGLIFEHDMSGAQVAVEVFDLFNKGLFESKKIFTDVDELRP